MRFKNNRTSILEEEYIVIIPVEGHASLGRDPSSNAILNTDSTQYDAYIKARNKAKQKDLSLIHI